MMAHKNALDMQLYLDRLSIEADVSRRLMRLPQLFGDAAVLAEIMPTGMLFVRNPTGISHSPEEYAEIADCHQGARALAAVMKDWVA